jgi:hypothetical protein
VNDLNQDTILSSIGLITDVDGEELRIILSKINNKEYVTIRDACLPYAELKDVFVEFEEIQYRRRQIERRACEQFVGNVCVTLYMLGIAYSFARHFYPLV